MIRTFGYYLSHTFVNVIKKLFKTWIAIFLAIIVVSGLFGGIIGMAIGMAIPDDIDPDAPITSDEELLPDEDVEDIFVSLEKMKPEDTAAIATTAVFAVMLIFLGFEVLSAEKGKQQLFSMPDVNFLFSSPTKPQSVLTFRTIMVLGRYILLVLYLGLCWGMGLPAKLLGIGLLLLALAFVVIEIISIILYGVANTHDRAKPLIKPVGYALLALVPLIMLALYMTCEEDQGIMSLVRSFGSISWLRLIPFIGWIAAIGHHFFVGEYALMVLYIALTLVGIAMLGILLAKLRFDFYESGLASASKLQELLDAQSEKRQARQRKKDRSDKVRRDIIRHGSGASTFFHKSVALTHRSSFALLLTPGSATWLGISMIVFVLTRIVAESHTLLPLMGIYLFGLFILSFGNPLSDEFDKNFIWLAPMSNLSKLAAAFAGAEYRQILNFLPAYLIGAILIGASPLDIVLSALMLVSVSLFFASSGLLTGLIVPTSLPTSISSMIQMCLKMLTVMPTMIIFVIFLAFDMTSVGYAVVSLFNLALAAGLFFLSLLPMAAGKK